MKKEGGNGNDYYGMACNAFDRCCETQWGVWKDLTALQLHLAELWQEYLSEQLQRLSRVGNPAEIFTVESDLVTEYTARVSEETCKCLETLTGAQRDLLNCFNFAGTGKRVASPLSVFEENPAESRPEKRTAHTKTPRQLKTSPPQAHA